MDMEFDVNSETPPSSPVMGYSSVAVSSLENFSINEYSFECKGPIRPSDPTFSPQGLISTGDLIASIKLISKNSSFNESFDTDVEDIRLKFFNHTFEPTGEMLKIFILICRKHVDMLESLVHPLGISSNAHGLDIRSSESDCDAINFKPWDLRRDVCNFVNFIVKYSNSVRLVGSDSLLNQFNGLRKSLGLIEDWPSALKSHGGSCDGNKCSSAYYHFFHVQLELRWFFLVLSGESLTHLDWVLDDLIYLAWFKYTSEKMNEWNSMIGNFVAFNCYCVKELWTMIRHIVDEFKPQGRDFWDFVTSALNRFSKYGNDLLFPLWLVVNLAPLGNYSLQGQYIAGSDEFSSNCYFFVREIVKESLVKNQNPSDIMDLAFKVLPYWGTDEKLMGALWDYWSAKIDNNIGVEDHAYWISPEKWLSLVKSLTAGNPQDLSSTELDYILKGDKFLSFIRLFCGHIKFCPKDSKNQQKLTTRIYIKLPNSKILKLSEIGLVRLGTLHLATISAAASPDDVTAISKRFNNSFHEIYEELNKKGKSSSPSTILTAQITMFLLLLDKGINVEPVAAPFIDQITNLMLRESKIQIVNKKDLIKHYMEFLDLLPKFSGAPGSNGISDLGQASLFSLHIPVWLSSAGPDYLNRTLRVCHNLLWWLIRNGDGCPELTKKIVECTKDFVSQAVWKKQSKSSVTDVEPLADLAADFTYLVRQNVVALDNCFNNFALEVNTSPEISSLYMDKILNSDFPHKIIIEELKLMQAWLRLICVGETVPRNLTATVLHCEDGHYGYSNDKLLEIFCEKVSDNDDCDRDDVEKILQPLVNLCEKSYVPLKANLKTIEATVRASSIILRKLKFMKLFSPKVPCVAKVIINFFSSLLSSLTDDGDNILVEYLPQFFEAVIAFGPWDFDAYLRLQVQQFVTVSFTSFTKEWHLRNFTNHPCYKIMKSAEEKQATYLMEEILPELKSVASEQKLNNHSEYLKTLFCFSKRETELVSIVAHSVPTVMRIVRLSGNALDLMTCAQILCSLFDSTLVSKCGLSKPVLETQFKHALEKEMDQHLALHYKKYFKLFRNMVATRGHSRSEVRAFFSDQLLPLIDNQIHFCQVRRGSGQNDSLRKEVEILQAELERNF